MLALYKSVSSIISAKVASDGLIATKTPMVRGLRTIKKEILRLFETYIKKAEDLEQVNREIIPQLLDAVLSDYHNNVPTARDAEVLNVMATIVSRLGSLLTDKISPVLDAVFEPTLNMINQDFSEFPEHRVGFFKLLKVIDMHCFPALIGLDASKFKLTMDSIVWAIKHTMRDIADMGLAICLSLVNNIAVQPPELANSFYQQYLLSIIQDTFYVLTDSEHKSGEFSFRSFLCFKTLRTRSDLFPLFLPSLRFQNSMYPPSSTLRTHRIRSSFSSIIRSNST